MKLLCERIRRDGRVLPGNVLKVDSFVNHQIDVRLFRAMGEEFYRKYCGCGVNKILTIEASGIGVACFTAQFFDVPVVFAKKSRSSNIPDEVYAAPVHSYTHGNDYNATVAKRFLTPDDLILIIDDFLANGSAMRGLRSLCEQAGSTVVGAGIGIEKSFQPGGRELRAEGLRIESLAVIDAMTEDGVVFSPESLA